MGTQKKLTESQKCLVESVFLNNKDLLYKKAYRIVGTKEDADDAVAMAMLNIMRDIERISKIPVAQVSFFCISMVKNIAIDMLRKKNRQSLFEIDEEGPVLTGEDPVQIAERNEIICSVREMQKALTEEERLLIHLRYDQEASYEEIAGVLGVTEEAAKKRGQRVLQKLRLHSHAIGMNKNV